MPRNIRSQVIACLRLFAGDGSPHEGKLRLGSDRSVPPEKLPEFLCRLWIDDVYLPTLSFSDGVNGEPAAVSLARFAEAFSESELEALARFHRFLELRLQMLANAAGRGNGEQSFAEVCARLYGSDAWVHICRDARNTLLLLAEK